MPLNAEGENASTPTVLGVCALFCVCDCVFTDNVTVANGNGPLKLFTMNEMEYLTMKWQ